MTLDTDYDPKGFKLFRKLDDSLDLRRNPTCTLILLTPNGPIGFGNTQGSKDALMDMYNPGIDTFLLAWNGQYRTDIFTLTANEIKEMYRR